MSAKDSKTPSDQGDKTMDWEAFDARTDQEILEAAARDPQAVPPLDAEWFKNAELVLPGRKRPISIRLDEMVLNYFMSSGPGYQSRINAVLRSYVLFHRGISALRGLLRAPSHGRPEDPDQMVVNPVARQNREAETQKGDHQQRSEPAGK
jgi:uncharacterized protein (DUF4415 family)